MFKKKRKKKNPLPSMDEVIRMMYSKTPDFGDDHEIADIIYSKSNAQRFIIVKCVDDGLYTYHYEKLFSYDEDEREFLNDYAYWYDNSEKTKSVFSDIDSLMRELKATPEYKLYFKD